MDSPRVVFCHGNLSPANIYFDPIRRNISFLHPEFSGPNFQVSCDSKFWKNATYEIFLELAFLQHTKRSKTWIVNFNKGAVLWSYSQKNFHNFFLCWSSLGAHLFWPPSIKLTDIQLHCHISPFCTYIVSAQVYC